MAPLAERGRCCSGGEGVDKPTLSQLSPNCDSGVDPADDEADELCCSGDRKESRATSRLEEDEGERERDCVRVCEELRRLLCVLLLRLLWTGGDNELMACWMAASRCGRWCCGSSAAAMRCN
jgi:hypothetical protein